MELDWFKDLRELARTGSFSRAAETNHLSQSAFSRRIKALEGWVGARLVDRSSHPVSLTVAGKQMLEAGEQALDRIEAERTQIRELLEQPDRYVVTFGTQHSIGWRFFPAWLQGFEQAFGPILSRLRADNLPDCIADLRRGEVDFVMAYTSAQGARPDGLEDCESTRIGIDQLIPVCRPDEDGRPLLSLAPDAQNIPYLRFGPSAPIGSHIDPVLAAGGLGQRLHCIYENAMAGALRIRARDGLGVAWLPRSLVEPDLDAGLLAIAGSSEWWIDLQIRLFRRQEQSNRLVRRIYDFIVENEGR